MQGNIERVVTMRLQMHVIAIFVALGISVIGQGKCFAQNERVLYAGTSGGDVLTLQQKLTQIGYYTGPLNASFTIRTYHAVRDFQYAFGLPIDGIVGAQTWAMLDRSTSGQSATMPIHQQPTAATTSSVSPTPLENSTFSEQDINLMAHVVYGEARGQPFLGQVAVAAVILNRYHSALFPHSIPAILFQPGAFTSLSNGQAWLGLHQENVKAVMDAIHGFDPTNGALYYWNPSTSTSSWIWSQPIMLTIGNHVFAK